MLPSLTPTAALRLAPAERADAAYDDEDDDDDDDDDDLLLLSSRSDYYYLYIDAPARTWAGPRSSGAERRCPPAAAC